MTFVVDGTNGLTQLTGSIVMSGSTSGTTTIIPSAVAGTTTVTMPAATGTMMVSGNMPAFSAYQSSAQTLSSGTFTKVQFQTEEFDTNNNFDSTTNYRFTPTVAGYYQINGGVGVGATPTQVVALIYKNGSSYKGGANIPSCYNTSVSSIVYLNGSTDYVELYCYFGSGQAMSATMSATYFNGAMVRSA